MPSWKKVIISGSDAALNSLNVTNSLTASGIIYPTTDGTSGQVVITDGNGNLSFSNVENTTITIKNMSGATIAKGTPCYITGSGTSGNLAGVVPADASNPSRMPAGVIAGETLIAGAEGVGLVNGFINGVNTSAFTPGATIYVAPGGGYTSTRPTGSSVLIQKLGNVEKSAINGSGVINGPGYYNEVPNIQQGYTWVGNNNGVAVAVPTSSLSVASSSFASTASFVPGYVSGSGTAGQVAFFNGVNSQAGDDALFWDDTNNRLGIGTNAPTKALTVKVNSNDDGIFLQGATNGPLFQVTRDGASNNTAEMFMYSGGNIRLAIRSIANTSYFNGGNFVFGATTAGARLDVRAQGALSTDIAFRVRNSADTANLVTVQGNGNVGIGTTSPSTPLHITTPTATPLLLERSAANVNVAAQFKDQTASWYVGKSSNDYFSIGRDANLGATTIFNINPSGNTGIGVTTPAYKLHVIDSSSIGTTVGSNVVARFSTLSSGKDSTIQLSDGVAYSSKISMLSGDLHLSTEGKTSAVTVKATTGNIGIGTTSPSALLHLKSDFSSGVAVIYDRTQNANIDSLFYTGVSTNGATTSDFMWMGTSTSDMTITGTGNVGIGTTAPYSKFTTYGALSTSTSQISIVNSEGGHTILRTGISGVTNAGFSLISADVAGTNQNTRVVVSSVGNVGIGTTTPSYTLDVTGSAGATARFKGTGQSTVSLNDGTNENYLVGVGGQIRLAPSGNTALVALGTGNVGIGTITPGDKLQVGGGVTAQSLNAIGPPSVYTSTGGVSIYHSVGVSYIRSYGNSSGTGTTSLAIITSGSERVRIDSIGNVGIGTTSPGAKLDVEGDVLIKAANLSNQENTDVDTGTEVVATVAIATYTAAFFDFVVKNGTNVRSGTVFACHDGTNVEYTETSTADLGTTSPLTLSVDISSGNMRLLATATTDNWSVKTLVRAL